VDVDEHEAWRISPMQPQCSIARQSGCAGRAEIRPLRTADRPEAVLTGDSIERVDTRVLQLIYEINPGDVPLFVGQQTDASSRHPPEVRPN
jgi:hypothetical protein